MVYCVRRAFYVQTTQMNSITPSFINTFITFFNDIPPKDIGDVGYPSVNNCRHSNITSHHDVTLNT